jgi:hypothetical protein
VLFLLGGAALAQPTYKLDVRPYLQPRATITLKGTNLTRSAVKDDPGFRLQYHIKKGDKTVETINARGKASIDIPIKETGVHSVALELFFPGYKTGNVTRGEYRAVSNVLYYNVRRPGEASQIQVLQPVAALVLECGKDNGKSQEVKVGSDFGYKLLQGTSFDGWPKSADKTHAWTDPKMVRFEITLPANTAGTLRLHCVDGDNAKRKQKVTVQGKAQAELENFAGPGRFLEVTLPAAETKAGKVEVSIEALNPGASAVISAVELLLPPTD